MIRQIFNSIQNSLNRPLIGAGEFKFNNGDNVIAEISTEGDFPNLTVAVAVERIHDDRSGATVVDDRGTKAPVKAHDIYSHSSRYADIDFIPKTYVENNLRIAQGKQPLDKSTIEEEVKGKVGSMVIHSLTPKGCTEDEGLRIGNCGM